MATISEFIISACELVEAQVDEVRRSFYKSASSLILVAVGGIVAMMGFGFLLFGIYVALSSKLGVVYSCLLTAIIAFFIAFILVFIARWKQDI